MITVRCPDCKDWSLSAPSGTGLLQALREHQQHCPEYRGINSLKALKEKTQ